MAEDVASIIHADLDSFFASVEQRDDPALRGRPVVVGGGVVLAASYEAKAYGVRSAMPERMARERCPGLISVPPRMDAYSAASKAVFAIFRDTTPEVEPVSIDEAFLAVGGLRRLAGTPTEIAVRLRARVRDEAGLPITVGVARTKHLAKVCSQVAKPDGLLVVEADEEEAFLHPLPVERLWGVGPVTSAKLRGHGITTVGDLARLPQPSLTAILGPASGRHLHALAHLRDPRPVDTGRRRRSIGTQSAMRRKPRTLAELDDVLVRVVDRLCGRLRDGHRTCRTVVLRYRHDDGGRGTRSHTLPQATDHTATVLAAARTLLRAAAPLLRERGCTLLGLSLTHLDGDEAVQLQLPFDATATSALDDALDHLRSRFGSGVVRRAAHLGRDLGPQVPVLDDG